MFSFFLQFFFFFRRVAGNPFGGSQSAVLVLPHHLTIFLELGYFLSFGKNMIQIQLKNLVIFMLSPNKKIEMANPFQLLVFLVIPILIIKESSFQCSKRAISNELCYLFSKSIR
jgi:hypothetical protein